MLTVVTPTTLTAPLASMDAEREDGVLDKMGCGSPEKQAQLLITGNP